MGKNKTNKKKNVFRVAGAKSLKPKKKAKAFTGNIKKIREILKDNIRKIDETLVNLEENMKTKSEQKINKKLKSNEIGEKIQEHSDKLEMDKNSALQKLHEMKF